MVIIRASHDTPGDASYISEVNGIWHGVDKGNNSYSAPFKWRYYWKWGKVRGINVRVYKTNKLGYRDYYL